MTTAHPKHSRGGGPPRAQRQRPAPNVTIIDALDDPALFGPFFGPSWAAWRAILKGAFGLRRSMTAAERRIFRRLAQRDPPKERVRELWVVAGRRAGKDSIASLIATYLAVFSDHSGRLRPGEKAVTAIIACSRDQAKVCLGYVKGYFEHIRLLRGLATGGSGESIEVGNSAEIAVFSNSLRLTRGRSLQGVVLTECAYYRDENSANPDMEVYNAVLPGLITLSGILIGISSGYRKSGLLFEKHHKHFGKDGDILVIQAASLDLNPTLDPAVIARAYEEDPAVAGSEWGGLFRDDVAAFIDRAVIDAAVVPGRHELPPVFGTTYHAFCDPSGGSADAMTLAIAHQEPDGRVVLDLVRERRPPFSPDQVCKEFAETLKSYFLTEVQGDRYGGQWPAERFRVHGVEYRPSSRVKSDIYGAFLPLINSGRVELLENARLSAQLASLERRTARGGGRDSIDHAMGGHDDLGNSVAGAVTAAAERPSEPDILMCVPGIIDEPRYDHWSVGNGYQSW